jgi:protein gp37
MIFVNSMSDLFHKQVDRDHIDRVFDVMEDADWHVFQVLTKRSSLMRDYIRRRYGNQPVPRHIWLGVSVEDAPRANRIDHLRQIESEARFISFEPLLGAIGEVDLSGIAWAIVGGESGPRARPMDGRWATEIRNQCKRDGVAFFFKQWGGGLALLLFYRLSIFTFPTAPDMFHVVRLRSIKGVAHAEGGCRASSRSAAADCVPTGSG